MADLLSVRAISKRLDVTTETVRSWIKAGKLEHSGQTPGGHYRVSEAQLAAMLQGPPPPSAAEVAEQEADIKAILVAARRSREEMRKRWKSA